MSTPASKAYVLSFGGFLVDDLTVSSFLPPVLTLCGRCHLCGDWTRQAPPSPGRAGFQHVQPQQSSCPT